MKKILVSICAALLTIQFNAQNIQFDKDMGAENAKSVEAQMGLYSDAKKTAYLRMIGEKLIAELDNPLFEYQFHLVQESSPNAFALPGGYLYVTTGLIPILQSEDELACIIGHEIIHSNNRHSVKQMRKSILPKLLEVPGNLLGMVNQNLGAVFNAPIQTSNALLFASYGRKFETEADREGIELAARAGYNPNAMKTALSRLSSTIEVAVGQEEKKSYFNDHPYTPDRVSAIQKNIKKMNLSERKDEDDNQNYLKNFDNILFGSSPAKGVVNKNTFSHPDLNFHITFPKKWAIDNQTEAIGAYQPDQKAAIFMTFADPKMTPPQAGNAFKNNLKDEYRVKIVNEEKLTINGHQSYLIEFRDIVQNETVYAYAVWIAMDGKLIQLSGITTQEYISDLKASAESLRSLTLKERSSFKINMLRMVSAIEGETISALNIRTGNLLNLALTCEINDISETTNLKEGQLIKIVKDYPYQIK